MHIRSIHIKGLKILTDIKLDFDIEADATLLFANNGIGKTTILEALSLVGHVSCMRRLRLSRDSGEIAVHAEPSILCRHLGIASNSETDVIHKRFKTF